MKNSLCALRLGVNLQRSKSNIPQVFRVAIVAFWKIDCAKFVFLSISFCYSLRNPVDAYYYVFSNTQKSLCLLTLEMINAILSAFSNIGWRYYLINRSIALALIFSQIYTKLSVNNILLHKDEIWLLKPNSQINTITGNLFLSVKMYKSIAHLSNRALANPP